MPTQKIIFVTSNAAKVRRANTVMKTNGFGIRFVRRSFDFSEPQDQDVAKIVGEKAKQAAKKFRRPFVVEDRGVYIPALKGFPGMHAKHAIETIGAEGIVKLMEGERDRRVSTRTALAFARNGKIKIFLGEYGGIVAHRTTGKDIHGWSDLHKIFIPAGYKKTLAQMSKKEWLEYQKNFVGPYIKFARWLSK